MSYILWFFNIIFAFQSFRVLALGSEVPEPESARLMTLINFPPTLTRERFVAKQRRRSSRAGSRNKQPENNAPAQKKKGKKKPGLRRTL